MVHQCLHWHFCFLWCEVMWCDVLKDLQMLSFKYAQLKLKDYVNEKTIINAKSFETIVKSGMFFYHICSHTNTKHTHPKLSKCMDMNKICHKFRAMCIVCFLRDAYFFNFRWILVTWLKSVDRDDNRQTSPVLLSAWATLMKCGFVTGPPSSSRLCSKHAEWTTQPPENSPSLFLSFTFMYAASRSDHL